MNTTDLAAEVPELMTRHPHCRWQIVADPGAADDLVIELRPAARPERLAVVRVNSGAEVFSFVFGGHHSHDFAHDDADRLQTLRDRIDRAVEAACGPTRVVLERAGDTLVKSTLVIDPDGPAPRQEVSTYPLRRLAAIVAARRVVRTVTDHAADRGRGD